MVLISESMFVESLQKCKYIIDLTFLGFKPLSFSLIPGLSPQNVNVHCLKDMRRMAYVRENKGAERNLCCQNVINLTMTKFQTSITMFPFMKLSLCESFTVWSMGNVRENGAIFQFLFSIIKDVIRFSRFG